MSDENKKKQISLSIEPLSSQCCCKTSQVIYILAYMPLSWNKVKPCLLCTSFIESFFTVKGDNYHNRRLSSMRVNSPSECVRLTMLTSPTTTMWSSNGSQERFILLLINYLHFDQNNVHSRWNQWGQQNRTRSQGTSTPTGTWAWSTARCRTSGTTGHPGGGLRLTWRTRRLTSARSKWSSPWKTMWVVGGKSECCCFKH